MGRKLDKKNSAESLKEDAAEAIKKLDSRIFAYKQGLTQSLMLSI